MRRGNLEIPRGETVSEVGAHGVRPANRELGARRAPLQFWLVAFLVVLLDQVSKLWVRSTLAIGETRPVLENWLVFTHSKNNGAAWGMMSGQRWLLILVSIGVGAFILFMAREFAHETKGRVLALSALGLIFGGAIGNLIDRAAFGVVTDFFDLETPLRVLQTFPIFNIADSALTVGVILLMLHFLLHRDESEATVTTQNNASDSL